MVQRVSKAGNIKYALSGDDDFIASVEPGETFVVECAINVNDGTIRHLGQQLTESRRHASLRQWRDRARSRCAEPRSATC